MKQESPVFRPESSQDNEYLATVWDDNLVIFYEPESGDILWNKKFEGNVNEIVFSPDRRYFTISYLNKVRCYRLPLKAPWKKKYDPEWVFQ